MKLLPDQVAMAWDWFGSLIEDVLVPKVMPSSAHFHKILEAVLSERLDCWLYRKGTSLTAAITTVRRVDEISGYANLLVYSLSVFDQVDAADVTIVVDTLKKYAKAVGCSSVVAYTYSPKLAEISSRAGADVSEVTLRWEV